MTVKQLRELASNCPENLTQDEFDNLNVLSCTDEEEFKSLNLENCGPYEVPCCDENGKPIEDLDIHPLNFFGLST